MIKKNTVFVLGAGASAPYGFPCGDGLVKKILEGLSSPATQQQWFASLVSAGTLSDHAVRTFEDRLRGAGRPIDQFLQDHPKYKKIGKLAIARVLMPCEDDLMLEHDRPGPKYNKGGQLWYWHCFEQMRRSRSRTSTSGGCQLESNNLSVITFNFDRSFERQLFRFAQENCVPDRSRTDAARVAQRIPVYHIHGQLGAPDWLEESNSVTAGNPRAYGEALGDESLRQCAKQILILNEEVITGPAIEGARGALKEAKTVCFLGFSYERSNLHTLFPEVLRGKDLVLGTAFSMDDGDLRGAERALGELIPDTTIELCPSDRDVLDLLKDKDVLHSDHG